ncbi:hypothetical protein CEP54_015171 [Fusarium duplospermum]|uniref:Uncharacterized protein n=1 Tax=Fusarium duplospermum TaxID=1325734 RepID=A0A428NR39_9HYPO|nr:hypothetical protein CEP54_015171 [Fusarium duplospermum]
MAICGYNASRILLFAARSGDCRRLLLGEENGESVAGDAVGRVITVEEALQEATRVLQFLRRHCSASDMGQRIVANLEKEISQATVMLQEPYSPSSLSDLRAQGHDDISGGESPYFFQDSGDASAAPSQYARAIKDYQRLGVHSIVRLAGFE